MNTSTTPSTLEFAQQFIHKKFMAVVACISEGYPRTFTCWYCVHNGSLYWKSRTSSEHSQAFAENPEASLCIYDHAALYPDNKIGVQVLGRVEKVTDKEDIQTIVDLFAKRFGEKVYEKNTIDELCAPNTQSAFYRFTAKHYKLVNKDMNIHMERYEPISL